MAKAVNTRSVTKGVDYTTKDYEGFRTMMIDHLKLRMPEYTDMSQTDAGITIIESNAKACDILSFYQDAYANELMLSTCEQRDSTIPWCDLTGYVPKNATPSHYMQIFVLNEPQKEDLVIPKGTKIKTYATTVEQEVMFETVEDLTIPKGNLGNEKNGDKWNFAVEVVQGYTIESELVGSSNGTSNQSFTLKYTPVIIEDIDLYINDGFGYAKWERVDSFIDSNPEDLHFTATLTSNNEALIKFGNGTSGKIPPIYEEGIFADYRIGGGTAGNVGAKKINVLEQPNSLIKETYNPDLAFILGEDKDSLEEIRWKAPAYLRSKWGAVTAEDYVDLTLMNFGDRVMLASAEADTKNVDNLLLYVLLKDLTHLSVNAKLVEEIQEFFADRKVLGTDKLTIVDAEFIDLNLSVQLTLKERTSKSYTEKWTRMMLEDYFKEGNYPFGKILYFSDLTSTILQNIDGLYSAKIVYPTSDKLNVKINQIVRLKDLTVTMTGGVD